ncbi:prepilin-type N-terminal cleavage/methylation domain-containing protein [Halobacteriovorax sp. GB3]|uniref:PulJ/GspJ family protein n=1 Tax=Halobacteriovorax sp. GB3 TaxID=2719615 RepID=UPI00235E8859|nr:prepilin-type N-terminal cleavage/methylation domain-containing protein [Halobacteriovorax sp. GB3]MDD0852296.1 prepilin-type N-terminal cleavage/methylation domain-containing protein [Halobacteriovorax sp. GB3]
MHSNSSSSQNGFSLLEVLVGLFLITFISMGMISTIDTVTTNLDTLSDEDPPYYQVESFFQKIQQDINAIYTPLYYTVEQSSKASSDENSSYDQRAKAYDNSETFPKVAQDARPIPLLDSPEKNTLIIYTSNHRRVLKNSKQSNYSWIRYSVTDMEKSPDDEYEDKNKDYNQRIVRTSIAENVYAPQFDWDSQKKITLLENVKQLQFLFWKKDEGSIGIKGKFVDNIKLLNGKAPRLFKVKVLWSNPGLGPREFNRVFRVQWPNFDTKKDWEEYQKALKANQKNTKSNNTPANGGFLGNGLSQDEDEEDRGAEE